MLILSCLLTEYAIIVAAGSGSRFKGSVPKQFLLLNNKPVLFYSINAFKNYSKNVDIIIVLPKNYIEYWQEFCSKYNSLKELTITEGGRNRFESVKKGLHFIKQESVIAVHDGVRPLINHKLIKRCYDAAKKHGSGIPVITPTDSLRKLKENNSEMVNRSDYKLIQTPQCFLSDIIIPAYKQPYNKKFTDDSAVIQQNGHDIKLVEGDPNNIKITTQMDMEIARVIIKN